MIHTTSAIGSSSTRIQTSVTYVCLNSNNFLSEIPQKYHALTQNELF